LAEPPCQNKLIDLYGEKICPPGPKLEFFNRIGPKLLLRDLVIAAWQLQFPGGDFAYVALFPNYIGRG
jgi:hypothetical protein